MKRRLRKIKILWICNAPIRAISDALKVRHVNNVGWMDGAFDVVMASEKIELAICYPQVRTPGIEFSHGHRVSGYGFPWDIGGVYRRQIRSLFVSILEKETPDIVHIFGTENEYDEAMAMAALEHGSLGRVVVSIQGLVSACGEHFLPDLPASLLKRATLSELKNHCTLINQKENYMMRGDSEKRLIRMVHHVIGRTTWDEGRCRLINPDIVYHHVGESLRNEFYEAPLGCDSESYRLYFSQGTKPIKAMHRLIEALPLVIDKIPDVEVVVAGSTGLRESVVRGLSYDRYLARRMDALGVRQRFKFLGFLDANAVVEAMSGCSAFISTSSIENSPNSMGEAMMLGLPCISSFVGGVPDIAEHGKEALLIPYNETELLSYSIIRLFEDQGLAQSLSEKGRARALVNHSKTANRRDLLGAYESILTCN